MADWLTLCSLFMWWFEAAITTCGAGLAVMHGRITASHCSCPLLLLGPSLQRRKCGTTASGEAEAPAAAPAGGRQGGKAASVGAAAKAKGKTKAARGSAKASRGKRRAAATDEGKEEAEAAEAGVTGAAAAEEETERFEVQEILAVKGHGAKRQVFIK